MNEKLLFFMPEIIVMCAIIPIAYLIIKAIYNSWIINIKIKAIRKYDKEA